MRCAVVQLPPQSPTLHPQMPNPPLKSLPSPPHPTPSHPTWLDVAVQDAQVVALRQGAQHRTHVTGGLGERSGAGFGLTKGRHELWRTWEGQAC